MKRIATILVSGALALGYLSGGLDDQKALSAHAVGELGFSEYVSEEYAPTIDGVRDEIYPTTHITTDQTRRGTKADVYTCWNESGLYFFVEVIDSSINLSDRCNLWVSEKYITGQSEYNNLTYPQVDGAWFLCLNPVGENLFDEPSSLNGYDFDMTGKYTVETTTSQNSYTVEVYIPRTGKTAFEHGNSIGFDVSIDDFLTESADVEGRDSYTNWYGISYYWEYPACLGEIVLVNNDETNGSPSVDVAEETSFGWIAIPTATIVCGCAAITVVVSRRRRKERD